MTFPLPPQYSGTAYAAEPISEAAPPQAPPLLQGGWGEDVLLLLGLIALLWMEGAEGGVIALLMVLLLGSGA